MNVLNLSFIHLSITLNCKLRQYGANFGGLIDYHELTLYFRQYYIIIQILNQQNIKTNSKFDKTKFSLLTLIFLT